MKVVIGAEDFGLTPLEANAAGRPVIAFAMRFRAVIESAMARHRFGNSSKA